MRRLLLWDIDGTLLSTDGIAANAMRTALRQLVGPHVRIERTSYAGKTDWQIVRESLPSVDEATIQSRLQEFIALYTAELTAQREALIARSTVFAGVVEALHALSSHAYQAPLTGNVAAAARIKLECTGLLRWLDVEAGAYGDDHFDRLALPPIAAGRARERYRYAFTPADVVIIGDTPRDIACGRSFGARTVAVATGPFSMAELAEYNPDVLLPDLRDTVAVVDAVLGN
ncbi:MAG: HAD hydrolase-like protein [Chloroflexus sp.]|uniref:HAD family hydrolase n=1 Tax=Chloroflexus sp. TaxID=1904827 RepID=UPI0021DC6AEB|nr:MAG: hydrolase [Chloroflexus sp.]